MISDDDHHDVDIYKFDVVWQNSIHSEITVHFCLTIVSKIVMFLITFMYFNIQINVAKSEMQEDILAS